MMLVSSDSVCKDVKHAPLILNTCLTPTTDFTVDVLFRTLFYMSDLRRIRIQK